MSSATWGVLMRQSRYAQRVIGEPEGPPPAADGRYYPPGWGATTPNADALRFAVIGDSLAAGIGAENADGVPGVQLARGLAQELGQPVDLITYAISGSTTKDMIEQVDKALANPPDVALVVIGGNDVTTKMSVRTSATLLGGEVARLRAAGAGVVVGTCPDLLPILPIHVPLRWVASGWSRLLARAQARAAHKAGGLAVPLGELVSPQFLVRPDELFSPDHFHPNGAGYEIAKAALLGPLVLAAGGDATEEPALTVTEPAVLPLGQAEPATS
ncbi:MAG TPA: SGNH/GDSL hydrolase family protein [Pseudonocardiaceae bacterium]|nr:SGNH/GDSL hydrolase family protein [Pseudonocardiaceae bacterium]